MTNKWFTRGMAAVGLLGALAFPARASYVEAENVQRLNGDPSPTQEKSNIDNYLFQDEQLNVQPTDGVVRVLRTDQKNLINDYVTAVFPIRNALPREMRNVLRVVTALEGGRAEVIIDKATGQNFVQVMAPQYMIPYLRDTIAALDVDWLKEYWDGAQDVYIKVQHRDAAEVDRIAENFAGDEGFSTIDTTNNALRRFDEEYRNAEYAKAVQMVDIPNNQVLLEVKMYEVNANNDVKLGLDYINWRNGPGRNLWSFIVAGYGAEQWAKGLTSVFDPFLDARTRVPSGDVKQVLDTSAVESYRAVNYLLTSNYVDFLQAKGKARLLTSQQIMVASSRTATVTAEREILALVNNANDIDTVVPDPDQVFIVRDNAGLTFVDTNRNGIRDEEEKELKDWCKEEGLGEAPDEVLVPDSTRRLNYRSVGVATTALTVTPYVGLESMELELDLAVGDLNGIAPSGLPIINTRTVQTTVRLLDGQPYVIAGLKRDRKIEQSAKVPFLGSIPGLGYLFGGESNLRRENNLVVVVVPHFILPSEVSIATPPVVKTLEAIVEGGAPLPLPENTPGYDQWLLGG